MHEQEKYLIAKLYSLAHDISIPEAYDIVRETQWQINDILSGKNPDYCEPTYNLPDEKPDYYEPKDALSDFLDLGPSYLYIFL